MAKGLSPWIKHVMATKRKMGSGTSLGAAMKKAKGTYKKGMGLSQVIKAAKLTYKKSASSGKKTRRSGRKGRKSRKGFMGMM